MVSMGPIDREQRTPRGSEFVFARLRYDSGDWDYNPKVAANLLNSIIEYTNVRVYPQEVVITADSDELGGFTITGVSGTGSKDDPIVITEQLNSASPVTLVIRATTVILLVGSWSKARSAPASR